MSLCYKYAVKTDYSNIKLLTLPFWAQGRPNKEGGP